MKFKEIVDTVIRHQIEDALHEGWNMQKKIESTRMPVHLLCLHFGIKKSLAKQAQRCIRRWSEIPAEEGFVVPPMREGLVKRKDGREFRPQVSRFDLPEELAKLYIVSLVLDL